MRSLRLVMAGIAICVVGGYAAGGEVVQSKKPRNPSPRVSQADLQTLVSGNTKFAYDLYAALRDRQANLFFSPQSISTALAMTYAGARRQTEREMAQALRFDLPQERLHPAFDKLDLTLASRGRGAAGTKGRGFQLTVVNSLWGQTGHKFLPTFLDTLSENYGAGMNALDFERNPEGSRVTINQWVAAQTNGKIQNLIPAGMIHPMTRLVLTDAVYFNAAWAHPFRKEMDCNGEFNLLNGQKVGVEMMVQTTRFNYGEAANYQVLEMPYSGEEISMVFLVPRQGKFKSFEGSLNAKRAQAILQDVSERTVHLTMPKFKHESSFALRKTLSSMGMPAAFREADFSGMDGTLFLSIDDVVHKALVRVDEEGTEAAAATAVAMAGGARGGQRPTELTIDRPFIFLIRDRETGAVVFMGRVVDPRSA
jgi:serpin B